MNGDGRVHFLRDGRVVIVGASLAGLRAAETLREEEFSGHLTLIGDEPYERYDRPPLFKQVLTGWVPPGHTDLPRRRPLDAEWRLGTPAVGLNLQGRRVRLTDEQEVGFDRLLIATGTRAKPWPNAMEASLEGVCVLRGGDDAIRLHQRLAAGRSGSWSSTLASPAPRSPSVCRELGLAVTVAERGPAPLAGAIGRIAAAMQRQHGVDAQGGVAGAAR